MSNQPFRPHEWTRRAFVGTAASAAAGFALGFPAFPGALAATDFKDFKLRAPEPNAKRGGVLRYGVLSAPAYFDVHQSGTAANMCTQGCMYDNLIRRDPRDSGKTIIPVAQELDDAKRKALIRQAEDIMERDPPLLPVSWEKLYDGWYNYVKGHNPYDSTLACTMWCASIPSGWINKHA